METVNSAAAAAAPTDKKLNIIGFVGKKNAPEIRVAPKNVR